MALLHAGVFIKNRVSFLSQTIVGKNSSLQFFFKLGNLNILEEHLIMYVLICALSNIFYFSLMVLLDKFKFIFFINDFLPGCYEILTGVLCLLLGLF